jgi:ATP-dependent HslUV protease subunit HslV
VLINKHPNQTLKNCITLAKKWRTNKMLGGLQATMILIDQDLIVELDGSGNVLEVKDTIGIGSGGQFA